MHIIVRIPGDVEIHNEAHGGDIETTTCHVGRDEDPRGAGAELGEVGCALGLIQGAVQACHVVVEFAEDAFEEVGGAGAVDEDDCAFGDVERREEEDMEEGVAVGEGDFEVGLVEGGRDGGGRFGGDLGDVNWWTGWRAGEGF